ncbi:MAG: diguanylate cyclase [Spirochaetes bacterium]|nr:diguanylate cyclase [Spirochaetota bacterium]
MKILLVNHTKSLLTAITQSLVDAAYSINLAEGINTIVEDIQRHNSQVVIINWTKADFDINGICKRVKKIKHTKYLYLIIIADRVDQKRLLETIDAGADDVIFKPFGMEELQIRMQVAKKAIKLEEAVKKFRKEMIKFAKEDPHTNLLNRRSLLDEALKEMMRASRESKYISSIMANITNFKELTENYGSEAGDRILLEFSRRLRASCRPYDKMGRIGISDFLLILPDTGIDNARSVADRMMETITISPLPVEGERLKVTLAIGVSELNPSDIAKNDHADKHLMNDLILDSLLRRSELALQKATERGKNSIEVYRFA